MTDKPWRAVEGGVEIKLRVTPRSRLDELAGVHTASDGSVSLMIKVRALPDKGAANAAVIETLAQALAVSKSRIRLVSGFAGRNKSAVVAGEAVEIRERLERHLGSGKREKN